MINAGTDPTFRVAVVLQIDSTNQKIVLREQNSNGIIQASTHLWDPLMAVPKQGDIWLVQRQGVHWVLMKKMDQGTEKTSLADLNPGDRRLESTSLHLNHTGNMNVTLTTGTLNVDNGAHAHVDLTANILSVNDTSYSARRTAATNATPLISSYTSTAAIPQYQIDRRGSHQWGPGGTNDPNNFSISADPDIDLYRAGPPAELPAPTITLGSNALTSQSGTWSFSTTFVTTTGESPAGFGFPTSDYTTITNDASSIILTTLPAEDPANPGNFPPTVLRVNIYANKQEFDSNYYLVATLKQPTTSYEFHSLQFPQNILGAPQLDFNDTSRSLSTDNHVALQGDTSSILFGPGNSGVDFGMSPEPADVLLRRAGPRSPGVRTPIVSLSADDGYITYSTTTVTGTWTFALTNNSRLSGILGVRNQYFSPELGESDLGPPSNTLNVTDPASDIVFTFPNSSDLFDMAIYGSYNGNAYTRINFNTPVGVDTTQYPNDISVFYNVSHGTLPPPNEDLSTALLSYNHIATPKNLIGSLYTPAPKSLQVSTQGFIPSSSSSWSFIPIPFIDLDYARQHGQTFNGVDTFVSVTDADASTFGYDSQSQTVYILQSGLYMLDLYTTIGLTAVAPAYWGFNRGIGVRLGNTSTPAAGEYNLDSSDPLQTIALAQASFSKFTDNEFLTLRNFMAVDIASNLSLGHEPKAFFTPKAIQDSGNATDFLFSFSITQLIKYDRGSVVTAIL